MIFGAIVVILGSVEIGTAPYSRQPGTFLPGADTRSIDPVGVESARWISTYLPSGSRVAGDLAEAELITGYSSATPESAYLGKRSVAQIFAARHLSLADAQLLARYCVNYIAVDDRDSAALPQEGHYFFSGDKSGYRAPILAEGLTKFASSPFVSRIYDSGAITVYELTQPTCR